ncbi:MAG: Asp-tRNA(Asn)/Glu-tRNA(Gln) amidotransferase subunit GatC [Myxococcales bacterium]
MSRIRPEEVREIAALARLALTDDEIARMTQDLDAILGYVEALRELDTSATEPMTHAVPFDCPLRPDVVEPALTVDEALRNAPRREQNFFQVPRIIASATGSSEEG